MTEAAAFAIAVTAKWAAVVFIAGFSAALLYKGKDWWAVFAFIAIFIAVGVSYKTTDSADQKSVEVSE